MFDQSVGKLQQQWKHTRTRMHTIKWKTNEISWNRLFNTIKLWIADAFNSISVCCRDFGFSLSFSRSPIIITRIFSRNSIQFYWYIPVLNECYAIPNTKHYRIFHPFTHSVGDQTAIFKFYASFLLVIFVGRWYLMDV